MAGSAGKVCPCGASVQDAAQIDQGAPDGEGLTDPVIGRCARCGRLLVLDDPNRGRVLQGKWRLERVLGRGGMGTVYLATELTVARKVALKFLHPRLAESDEYRSRFEREARVMGRVVHPNLASIYGVERLGTAPFLVMKFIQGRLLADLAARDGALPLERVMSLVAQIAAGLSALHAAGFVHRDLKPANVMVGEGDHVTLLDFGLTRTRSNGLTKPGVVLGSPNYMSPEQVVGDPSLDGRSDLYALALMTSELLAGRRPYATLDDTAGKLLQHVVGVPQSAHVANPMVPEAVATVLLKALAKAPDERQPTVDAFLTELTAAASRTPPRGASREATAPERAASAEPADVVAEEVNPESLSRPLPPSETISDAITDPVRQPMPSLFSRPGQSAGAGPAGTIIETEQPLTINTAPTPAWTQTEPRPGLELAEETTRLRPALRRPIVSRGWLIALTLAALGLAGVWLLSR